MTEQPTDPNEQRDRQQIDIEGLTRTLLDSLDEQLKQEGQDYETLTRQVVQSRLYKARSYSEINKLLSQVESITDSHTPVETQLTILENILPALRAGLDADRIFLLKSPHRTPNEQLFIRAQVSRESEMTLYDVAERETFRFPEESWQPFGNHKGIEIDRYPPGTPGTDEHSPLARFRRRSKPQGKPDYRLPMPEEPAEYAIVRVGRFDSPAKFVLVVHKFLRAEKMATYSEDLADLFDLLSMRLHEMYNLVEHRLAALRYDRARSEFMEDVMHQLSGSLSAISNMVENLIDGTAPQPGATLERLYETTHMFRHYTKTFALAADERSILDVYKQEAQVFSPRDWVNLLNKHSNFFIDRAASDGIRGPLVSDQGFWEFPPVSVRTPLVELLIFNLIDNAVKYALRGRNAPIVLEGERSGNWVRLRVSNYGVGIPEDERDQIFQRYFRSDRVRHIEANGTGVGLYICQEIMRVHEGHIFVESHPSSEFPGSHEVVFVVEFPALPEEYAEDSRPEEQSRPTILFVEDEPWKHRGLIERLEAHYEVFHARTRRRALDILKTHHERIQLILLDVTLADPNDPALTGAEAGIALAKSILLEKRYDIPILGWTGQTASHIYQELLSLGVKRVIHRTEASGRELVQTIEEYLRH